MVDSLLYFLEGILLKDENEHARWLDGSDDLSMGSVLDTLENTPRDRSILLGPRSGPTDFAVMLVETFITFPGMVA